MFDLSPSKLLLLAAVALIVFGPERLPGLAKDAARMLRTLRELSSGARAQLGELGPEFAELAKLQTLNPRKALTRAVLGDDADTLTGLDPRTVLRQAIEDAPDGAGAADAPAPPMPGSGPPGMTKPTPPSGMLPDAT